MTWEIQKSKVKSLANLRKLISGSDDTDQINALNYFSRLVLFVQSNDNFESSLSFYQLTLIPISLFLDKDKLMHEVDKVTFAKLINNSQDIDIDTVVIDGGRLLQQFT